MPKARAGPHWPLAACCSSPACGEEQVGVSTAGIPTPTLAAPGAGALVLWHGGAGAAGGSTAPASPGGCPSHRWHRCPPGQCEARATSQGSVTEVAFPRVSGDDPGSLLKAAGTCDGLQDRQGRPLRAAGLGPAGARLRGLQAMRYSAGTRKEWGSNGERARFLRGLTKHARRVGFLHF